MSENTEPVTIPPHLTEIRSEASRLAAQLSVSGLGTDSISLQDHQGTAYALDPDSPGTILGTRSGRWSDGKCVISYQRAGRNWRLTLEEVPF